MPQLIRGGSQATNRAQREYPNENPNDTKRAKFMGNYKSQQVLPRAEESPENNLIDQKEANQAKESKPRYPTNLKIRVENISKS